MSMVSVLVQAAFATACMLFVASLPILKLPIAAKMRRIAGALFLVAFLPSVFVGLIAPSPATAGASSGGASAEPFSVIAGFVVLSLISYAVLEIRKRMKKTSKDAWSEYVSLRSSGKKPVDDPRATHAPSLFDEEP
jgi:hypothetical protein